MGAPDGGPISIGDLMGGILFEMSRQGLCLRGDVAGQMVSFSITEGLVRQLDPPFDMVKHAKPYLRKYSGTCRKRLSDKTEGRVASLYRRVASVRSYVE